MKLGKRKKTMIKTVYYDNIKKILIQLSNPDVQSSLIHSIETIEKKFHSSRMKVENLQKEVMKGRK